MSCGSRSWTTQGHWSAGSRAGCCGCYYLARLQLCRQHVGLVLHSFCLLLRSSLVPCTTTYFCPLGCLCWMSCFAMCVVVHMATASAAVLMGNCMNNAAGCCLACYKGWPILRMHACCRAECWCGSWAAFWSASVAGVHLSLLLVNQCMCTWGCTNACVWVVGKGGESFPLMLNPGNQGRGAYCSYTHIGTPRGL